LIEFKYMTPFKSPPEKCPVCGATPLEGGFKFIQNYSDGEAKWSLYECPDCALQFWNPFELPKEGFYEQSGVSGHFVVPWNFKEFFRISPKKGGRLLDIGCGRGEFLFLCKKAGYSVQGLEVNEYDVKYVQKNGINCFFGYLDDFAANFKKTGGEFFDCVTFFEVIEHLTDPRGFLKDVHSILKPGGVAVFSTPFRERIEVFKMTDYPPGHVVRWNEVSLSRVLKDSGFEVEAVKIRPFSFHYLMGNFFQAYKFRNLNKLVKLALSGVLSLIFWLPMALRGGKGNRIFVVARKA
jgi:SAM-dependent methyltransferase